MNLLDSPNPQGSTHSPPKPKKSFESSDWVLLEQKTLKQWYVCFFPFLVCLLGSYTEEKSDNIDPKTQEIKHVDNEVYSNMKDLEDELPESSPRFVLLSYPLTLVCSLSLFLKSVFSSFATILFGISRALSHQLTSFFQTNSSLQVVCQYHMSYYITFRKLAVQIFECLMQELLNWWEVQQKSIELLKLVMEVNWQELKRNFLERINLNGIVFEVEVWKDGNSPRSLEDDNLNGTVLEVWSSKFGRMATVFEAWNDGNRTRSLEGRQLERKSIRSLEWRQSYSKLRRMDNLKVFALGFPIGVGVCVLYISLI